jgi:hypothetical protein
MRSGKRAAGLGVAALAVAGGLGLRAAADPAAPFRSERPAVLREPGPESLAVDVPLLVGSAPFHVETWPGPRGTPPRRVARGGLRDLRLYDTLGREVPYLLIEPPSVEPEWRRAATLLPIPATKKESGFEADLGVAPTVDRLRVEGLPAPFLKRLALDGSGDRQRWTRLAPEATLFDLPDSGLRQLELAFPPGVFRYLRVTWDDSSSARVPLPAGAAARTVRADAPARLALAAPVVFARRASEPAESRFRLRLPAPSLPVVALRLTVGGGNLMRRARVSESRLAGEGAAPFPLGEGTLRRAVRDVLTADELRIPIEPPSTAELDLEVDDGDNPPLELSAVEVELAELPWIYLEVAEPLSLVARWGRPGLDAPRYDLESARERAAQSPAPPAGTWGEAAPPSTETRQSEAPATQPTAGPPLDATAFRYARTLAGGPPGLVAVPLDAAVLAHSSGRLRGDFADLRVVDAAGRQLPYLLDRRAEPLVVALPPVVPTGETAARFGPNTSVYRLQLPYATLPPSRLVLRTSARVFDREVRVLVEPAPGQRRKGDAAQTVASATWRHAEPDTAAAALTLALPTLASAEVLLAVSEGDNPRLPLAAPELLLPCWHVRLFRSAGELRLLYGQDRLAPPRYDLALLAPTVLASPALETALAAEREATRAESVILRPAAFWALIIAAVAVLLVLIARLVRSQGPSRPD